jgi:hypothetical protein
MRIGEAVNAIWRQAEQELGANSDYTEIMRLMERLAGL